MDKTQEILAIDRSIRDAEIRLQTIIVSRNAIQKELDDLAIKEEEIRENIKCLKKYKMITAIAEFKKAKEELLKIKSRETFISGGLIQHNQAINELNTFLNKSKTELDVLNAMEHNVIIGNFVKK